MSSRNNGQTVSLISCRSTHHYFLDNCADSSIWWHFKLYWTLIHVCNKMKRIVLGSSLPDDKLIKLHNSLCSQMEDIGLAWFDVAWDVGLKLPSLSAWPWTVKVASLLFRFSVIQAIRSCLRQGQAALLPRFVRLSHGIFSRFSMLLHQRWILLSAIPNSHCAKWFLCCLANNYCRTFNFSTVVLLCPFVFAAAMIDRKFTMIAIKMLQNSLFSSIIFKVLNSCYWLVMLLL